MNVEAFRAERRARLEEVATRHGMTAAEIAACTTDAILATAIHRRSAGGVPHDNLIEHALEL